MKTFFLIFAAAFLLSCSSDSLHDSRDGKTYKTIKIGKQTWMAENLNFDAGGSACYNNNSSNCTAYGRLYNWNTALTVCPSGWRLPTDAEWTALTNHAGSNAGTKLKANSSLWFTNTGTDDFGFSALPGGIGWEGSFSYVGNFGFWWSATESDASNAWFRSMNYNFSNVPRFNDRREHLFSVRCVKD
ncbi:MAG: fibrobacter succinogenes major paralogous domain-containing protein [Fibromonadaceae bacterium]|nr:fibrobacter succinogenes major paralogous domain-containing protein [Fibromonadaceae bacterium]